MTDSEPSASAPHAEIERLRSLLHDIAVARRGDCPDVDESWEDLPDEILGMWRTIRDHADLLANVLAPENIAEWRESYR